MFLKICCLLASMYVAVHGQGYASRDDMMSGGRRTRGHIDVPRTVHRQQNTCPIDSIGPCGAGLTGCPPGYICENSWGTGGCCYQDSHSTLTSSNCIQECGFSGICPRGYQCTSNGRRQMCCSSLGQGGLLGRCPRRQVITMSAECSHLRFNPRVNCNSHGECPDGSICCEDDCGMYKVCRYPV